MTDEEGLLRTVIASPHDDLPRLVYADWLDERGDPRGSYLRLEREAVRTGDVEGLRQAASGLDPVWVARVSLPPIGVCVDPARLTTTAPPTSEAEVAAAERQLGGTFPADYRAFLLNYNGGWFNPGMLYEIPTGGTVSAPNEVYTFHPVAGLRGGNAEEADQFRLTRETAEAWLARHVVVALDDFGARLILVLSGLNRGSVFWDAAASEAGTFAHLLPLRTRRAANQFEMTSEACTFAELLASLPWGQPANTATQQHDPGDGFRGDEGIPF